MLRTRILAAAVTGLLAFAAQAQSTDVAFAGLKTDVTKPVQVTADKLSINQTDGTAVFTGNVLVTQDSMTLQSATLHIQYGADKKSMAVNTISLVRKTSTA